MSHSQFLDSGSQLSVAVFMCELRSALPGFAAVIVVYVRYSKLFVNACALHSALSGYKPFQGRLTSSFSE